MKTIEKKSLILGIKNQHINTESKLQLIAKFIKQYCEKHSHDVDETILALPSSMYSVTPSNLRHPSRDLRIKVLDAGGEFAKDFQKVLIPTVIFPSKSGVLN